MIQKKLGIRTQKETRHTIGKNIHSYQHNNPCKHRNAHTPIQSVRDWDERQTDQPDKNVMEEARGLRRWHSSCDNWVCFDTLSSGRRIFPRAAGSSDGAQRLREQPRECKRARVEVILHSRLNELARLFRQLKRNDPLPVHILISPFCSTADGFTSLPETLRYSLKRFDIGLFCTIIWVTHTVLYEVVRCIVAKAVQRTLDFHPSASFQRFNLYLYLNICDILYVISLLV